MAVGRHFENGFIAITQPGIIRFHRNLVCSRKLRFQEPLHDKVPQFYKFKMADGRHNENRFSTISGRFIVWLTRNFVQRSIITLRHRLRDQNIPAVDIWTAIIKQQIWMKKTVVYQQLITAIWHIENGKNNERWYYFRSTLTPAKCCWSNITVDCFCRFRCVISPL